MDFTIKDSKVINSDGCVAVLYSPGFGAGFYTWNTTVSKDIVFDPRIVTLVMEKNKLMPKNKLIPDKNQSEISKKEKSKQINKICDQILEICFTYDENFYPGGIYELDIEWVPEGTAFDISEYDGSESVESSFRTFTA
jgi:hypothetical protein